MINGIIKRDEQTLLTQNKSYTIEEEGKVRLFMKPFDSNHLMWQITINMGEQVAKELQASKTPENYLEIVKQYTKTWKNPILE